MTEIECLVCFCDIEGKSYGCMDPTCDKKVNLVCEECMQHLIKYSLNNQLIPTCVNSNCNSYYTLSSLKGLSSENILQYNESCMDFFMKDKGDIVQKQLEEKTSLIFLD